MQWNDNQPIYRQLRDQVIARILDGDLAEGDPLPSVRTVAVDYQLNPITVSKAYQILVDEGLVEKRRGLGMFVITGAKKKLLATEKDKFIQEEWPEILERVNRMGIDLNQLIEQTDGAEDKKK